LKAGLTPAFNYIASQCVGTYKFSQFGAIGGKDGIPVSLPQKRSLIHEGYLISDFQDGIHVMGIDDCSHIEFLCKVADQFVNDN
jgi:hypothetical protein